MNYFNKNLYGKLNKVILKIKVSGLLVVIIGIFNPVINKGNNNVNCKNNIVESKINQKKYMGFEVFCDFLEDYTKNDDISYHEKHIYLERKNKNEKVIKYDIKVFKYSS